MAQQARVKKLVLTHLPSYLSIQAAVNFAGKYYGPHQDRGIWTEFISAKKKIYHGSLVMGEDALVIEIGKP